MSSASVLFLFDDTSFAFEFGDEFGLGGEDGAVFGDEELFAAFEDEVWDEPPLSPPFELSTAG